MEFFGEGATVLLRSHVHDEVSSFTHVSDILLIIQLCFPWKYKLLVPLVKYCEKVKMVAG